MVIRIASGVDDSGGHAFTGSFDGRRGGPRHTAKATFVTYQATRTAGNDGVVCLVTVDGI